MFHYQTEQAVFISGASRGIGLAIAKMLSELGFLVIGTATTVDGVSHITSALANAKQPGFGLLVNLHDPESIPLAMEQLGKLKIMPTIFIHNAGITSDKLLLRMDEQDWLRVLEVNLTGAFRLTKSLVSPMLKARFGRIIFISSVIGFQGNAGQSNYAASKSGLVGLAKSLARELAGRKITVNTIAPGFVETEMTSALSESHQKEIMNHIPLGRVAAASEIAAAVAYLISNEATYITGNTLHINGGLYMN